MREIRFRGISLDTGKYVYAELGQVSEEINPGYLTFLSDDGFYTVETDTVAQLVGYDANGKEIYEGDTVIEEYVQGEKREAVAFLASVTRNPEGTDFFPFPAPFTTLKEADQ